MAKPTPIDQFEEAVFLDVSYFQVVRFLGRAQFERQQFPRSEFAEALSFAREPLQGRPRMIYAVSALGRSVCLEPAKDEHWKALAARVCL